MNGETKETPSLLWKVFSSFWWHSGTQQLVGIAKYMYDITDWQQCKSYNVHSQDKTKVLLASCNSTLTGRVVHHTCFHILPILSNNRHTLYSGFPFRKIKELCKRNKWTSSHLKKKLLEPLKFSQRLLWSRMKPNKLPQYVITKDQTTFIQYLDDKWLWGSGDWSRSQFISIWTFFQSFVRHK